MKTKLMTEQVIFPLRKHELSRLKGCWREISGMPTCILFFYIEKSTKRIRNRMKVESATRITGKSDKNNREKYKSI